MATWAGKHRAGIAYCLVFLVTTCVVFFDYIFGSRIFVFIDMGLDTCDQYFAYYTYLADALRDGDLSLWNFNFGVGIDQLTMQSWVMDPFAWLIVLPGFVFGIDAIRWSVLAVHIVKICLLVALFDRYLKNFGISDYSRVVFATLYGFNGFMMLWGQHYFFGTTVVYLTLLLCVVEWYLRDQGWKSVAAIVVVVFLLALFSVYTCYMTILFGACYAVIRLAYVLPRFSWGAFFKRLYPMVISVLIGICLAGFVFVPTALGLLTGSGRFEASTPLVERCVNAVLNLRTGGDWLVLSRFLSNNLLFTMFSDPAVMSSTNYYEFPQMAVTFAFFLIVPQFFVSLFREERSRRRKILVLIATLLIVCYFACDILPLALNAFVAASYRSTYVIVPLLCLACAIAWDKVIYPGCANMPALVAGLVVNLGVLAASLWYSITHGFMLLFGIGAVMAAGTMAVFVLYVLAKGARSARMRRLCIVAIACILLGATACDGYITNCHRDTWTNDMDFLQDATYGADTMQALAFIKESDQTFYRIEKTFTEVSGTGDSLYQDYPGVTSYNSTLVPGMVQFYRSLWPEISTPNGVYQTYWDAPDNPELATLMGIKYLISRDELNYGWLEEVETPARCHVYRNVLANSIGTKVYKALSGGQYDQATSQGAHLLDDYVVFDESDSSFAWQESKANPTPAEKESILFSNDDTFYRENDAFVYGMCSMPQDGYLILAIPTKAGWEITVDGQQAEVLQGDYGLCTVRLSAGEHEIQARYRIAGLNAGAVLSLVGLVLLALWLALRIRQQARGR